MRTTFRERIENYRTNTGTGWAIWNLLIVGYFAVLVLRTADPLLQAIAGFCLVAALLTGWLIMPIASFNFRFAVNLVRIVQLACVGVILVSFLKLVQFHVLVYVAMIAVMMWVFAANFWLISGNNVLTTTGAKYHQKRYERQRNNQYTDNA